jgi:hypothetical protein
MPAPVKATTFFDRETAWAVFWIRSSFKAPPSNAECGIRNAEQEAVSFPVPKGKFDYFTKATIFGKDKETLSVLMCRKPQWHSAGYPCSE